MQVNTRNTLGPWTFLSPEFFQLETGLFKSHWLLAGHISELQNPGDYLTLDAVGERAIVIVDQTGSLRGYHNVCRHRGARLLENNGHCKNRISCPFHGWSYGLDGTLQSYPLPDTFDNLNKQDYALKPVNTEVWQGLVFVNFSNNAEPLASHLKHIVDEVTPYKIADMQPLDERYDVLRPYNWKVIHEIDNEGYHVPVGHPSLQQLYGKSYQDRIEHGVPISTATINTKPAKLWSVRNYQKLLPSFEHLPEHRQKNWWFIGLFPNAVIALYPDMVEYYMTIPVSVDQTRYRGQSFALADSRPEVAACRYLNRRINAVTDEEDESYVSDMQQGMRSSAFPEPTLSSAEAGVQYFHHQIQKLLPVSTLRNEPPAGSINALNEMLENQAKTYTAADSKQ